MIYKATIIVNDTITTKQFPTMYEAAYWLDRESMNIDATSIIETYDENGDKKDGFFYTRKLE